MEQKFAKTAWSFLKRYPSYNFWWHHKLSSEILITRPRQILGWPKMEEWVPISRTGCFNNFKRPKNNVYWGINCLIKIGPCKQQVRQSTARHNKRQDPFHKDPPDEFPKVQTHKEDKWTSAYKLRHSKRYHQNLVDGTNA